MMMRELTVRIREVSGPSDESSGVEVCGESPQCSHHKIKGMV